MPKLSVIIPVYNVEEYLAESLESILNQSFCDIEIICINDGSSDKSFGILNDYKNKDDRIKIINQNNKGVSAARNRGLEIAQGEYIAFVDPDDWIEPNCFELAYSKAKNTNADIVCFGSKDITEDIVKEKNIHCLHICSEEKNNLNEIIHLTHVIWNKLFKNSFLKEHDIKFAESLKIAEDGVFNYFCILSNPKMDFLPTCLYNHRISRCDSLTKQITPDHDIEACKYLINTDLFINAKTEYKIMAIQKFIMNMLWWAKLPRAKKDLRKNKKAIRCFKNYLIKTVGDDIAKQCLNYKEMKEFCCPNYLAKIFSLTNAYSLDGKKRKVINILGIKIKLCVKAISQDDDCSQNEEEKSGASKSKISVIVPVYNVESYLSRCLDSLLNQTLKEIEIICVNDGSTDRSGAVLQDYAKKDPRIKIVNKEYGGVSSARNEGLKNVQTDYIGFVDSDDWVEPDTYKEALNAIEKNNVELVCWGANIVSENKNEESIGASLAKDYHKIKLAGKIQIDDAVLQKTPVTLWNKLFKTKIIKENNLNFPNGLLYEDNEFFLKYATHCQSAYYIDKYLYNYVQRPNSIIDTLCAKKTNTAMDHIKIYENIYKYYEGRALIEKHRELLSNKFDAIMWNVCKHCNDKKLIRKKLGELAQVIDNNILKNENIELIKKKKFHKINKVHLPKIDFGGRLLGFEENNEKIIFKFAGIKISLKKERKQSSKY